MIGSVVIFDNYADDNSFSQAPYVFDQGYKLLYAGLTHKLNNKTKLRAKYLWHNTAEDTLLGDDEIGHEFVAGVSYTIMKGLKAEINAGYLIGGDAWDALGTDGDSDDVFRTDARLRYKF
jgi:predicted porin